MSSRRFPGLELTEWRSRVVDDHPVLFPDAKPIRERDFDMLSTTGWPTVEDGWREIVETLCRRLDSVVERTTGRLALTGLDEKYGEMRVDWICRGLSDEEHAEVESIVQRAEARSSHTCGICGARGGIWDHRGWLLARCSDHGEGVPDTDPASSVRFSWVRRDGRLVRIARRYLYDRDAFVEIDHSSETP